jgi:hypothetical protein
MRKADNLTAICEPIIQENVGASTSQNPLGLHSPFTLSCFLPEVTRKNMRTLRHSIRSGDGDFNSVHPE